MQSRGLAAGYATWHEAAASWSAQVRLLFKFRRRWEQRTGLASLATWSAYTAARVSVRRILMRADGGGTSALCLSGINSWAAFVAAAELQELSLRRFAQRWGKSKCVFL
jgi:hypothetical protein